MFLIILYDTVVVNTNFFVQANNVLLEDLLNMDQAGIMVIPRWTRTLAPKGSKQVPGSAKKAMAQVTKQTLINAMGKILGYQVIVAGKTDKVHPKLTKPSGFSHYTHTPSHFANVGTLVEFAQKTIISAMSFREITELLKVSGQRKRKIRLGLFLFWTTFPPTWILHS